LEELREKTKGEGAGMSQIKNGGFYEKSKSLVIEAYGLLKSDIEKGESIPQDIIQDISIESDSEWAYRRRFVPILWSFVFRHRKEIEQSPQFLDWKQYMFKDENIKKHLDHLVGHSHEKSLVDVDRLLDTFLNDSFDETRPFEFDDEGFDRTYSKIEDFFYCENIKFLLSAPLQNFQCELEKIELANDLRIVKMSKQEREDLWRCSRYGGWLPDTLLPFLTHCVRLDFEKPKILEDSSQDNSKNAFEETPDQVARGEFDKLLSALRLFKPGVVGYNLIKTIPITWLPIGVGSATLYGHPLERGKYVLTESEANEFESFFAEFSKTKSISDRRSPIALALSRFNNTYERRRPEDKLIDYMIAFEALYLRREPGEYGYRMAIRVASMLGSTPEEKKQIFSQITTAYRLRGKIVHGSKDIMQKNSVSVEDISKVEQHLRHSIREFIKLINSETHGDIIKSLDESIFS